MNKASDGKIGTREFFAVILLMIGLKVTDSTPNILFEIGLNAAWFIPIVSAAVLFIPFLILLPLLKKHDEGLMELCYTLAGKFGGGMITFLLFLTIFFATVINSRNYVDITVTMYYPNTNMMMLFFFFILVASFFIANRGFEAIGRTGWFISPTIFFSIVILIVFVVKNMEVGALYPIAGPGVKELVKGGVSYSAFFADLILLCIFYHYVRSYKDFKTASFIGFALTCLMMIAYLATYVMVFGYPAVKDLAFPYHHLSRLAMIGTLANHVEAGFLGIWFMSATLHFAIYLYAAAMLLGKFLNFKEFERLLLPLAGLCVFLGVLPDNFYQGYEFRKWLLRIVTVFNITLPIFLWILDRRKRRKSK